MLWFWEDLTLFWKPLLLTFCAAIGETQMRAISSSLRGAVSVLGPRPSPPLLLCPPSRRPQHSACSSCACGVVGAVLGHQHSFTEGAPRKMKGCWGDIMPLGAGQVPG